MSVPSDKSHCSSMLERAGTWILRSITSEPAVSMTDVVKPPLRRFPGFPDRMELVPVPGAVFGTLLREIDDLAELKTLLHVLRLLHAQPRAPRFVRRAGLLADAGLLGALPVPLGLTAQDATSASLDLAVARGTLLPV